MAARAQAHASQPLGQHGEHRGFAAMQMIDAGGVDDDFVRRVGSDDRRETPEHPQCHPIERLGVSSRIGVLSQQALDQRLGLRRGHADAQTRSLGGSICRQHHAPPSIPTY